MYLLGKLPKDKPRPPRHPILWEDVRKLKRYSEQIKLLCVHKIDTSEQLQAFVDSTQSRMDELITQRTRIQNRLRRAKEPEDIAALKSEKYQLTQHLAPLRKDLKTASEITENAKRMREKAALVRRLEAQERQRQSLSNPSKANTARSNG